MVEVIEQIGGIKFADLRLYAIVLFTCCIFIVVLHSWICGAALMRQE